MLGQKLIDAAEFDVGASHRLHSRIVHIQTVRHVLLSHIVDLVPVDDLHFLEWSKILDALFGVVAELAERIEVGQFKITHLVLQQSLFIELIGHPH